MCFPYRLSQALFQRGDRQGHHRRKMSSLLNEASLQPTSYSLRSHDSIVAGAVRKVDPIVTYKSRGHDGGYELVSDARLRLRLRQGLERIKLPQVPQSLLS